jgi:hypothetical protein
VAQVRAIFKPHFPKHHALNGVPLAYVQWFSRPSQADKSTQMYVVKRAMDSKGMFKGDVIELASIARLIQLIPKFGPVASQELNIQNSMDILISYYVNSFADKENYQIVY